MTSSTAAQQGAQLPANGALQLEFGSFLASTSAGWAAFGGALVRS
jgi:hypothetical protein